MVLKRVISSRPFLFIYLFFFGTPFFLQLSKRFLQKRVLFILVLQYRVKRKGQGVGGGGEGDE